MKRVCSRWDVESCCQFSSLNRISAITGAHFMKIADAKRFPGLDDRLKAGAMQGHVSRSLQGILANAERGASSSKNDRLNAARAGIERNGNTAPGSEVRLTAHGLLAGGYEEADAYRRSLGPNDQRLLNASKKRERFDALSASEKARARELSQTYQSHYREGNSGGASSSSRGTRPAVQKNPAEASRYLQSLDEDKRSLVNAAKHPSLFDALTQDQQTEARALRREYQRRYDGYGPGGSSSSQQAPSSASSTGFSGKHYSPPRESSSSRPTTGVRSLTQAEIQRREEIEKWKREHGY